MQTATVANSVNTIVRARPKRVTFIVIVLVVSATLQTLGASYVLLVTLGLMTNPAAGATGEDAQTQMFQHAVTALTPTAALMGVLSNVVLWACIVGFWRMKKWSVLLYATLTAVNLFVVFVLKPAWMVYDPKRPWLSFLPAAIVLAIVASCWHDMQPRRSRAKE